MQMREPVCPYWTCSQGFLQAAVEAFHKAVRLRMVGSGLSVRNVEERAKTGPQSGSELRAPVTCNDTRDPKPLDPTLEEGRCLVGGGGDGQGKSFRPAGCPVYDGEEL